MGLSGCKSVCKPIQPYGSPQDSWNPGDPASNFKRICSTLTKDVVCLSPFLGQEETALFHLKSTPPGKVHLQETAQCRLGYIPWCMDTMAPRSVSLFHFFSFPFTTYLMMVSFLFFSFSINNGFFMSHIETQKWVSHGGRDRNTNRFSIPCEQRCVQSILGVWRKQQPLLSRRDNDEKGDWKVWELHGDQI